MILKNTNDIRNWSTNSMKMLLRKRNKFSSMSSVLWMEKWFFVAYSNRGKPKLYANHISINHLVWVNGRNIKMDVEWAYWLYQTYNKKAICVKCQIQFNRNRWSLPYMGYKSHLNAFKSTALMFIGAVVPFPIFVSSSWQHFFFALHHIHAMANK